MRVFISVLLTMLLSAVVCASPVAVFTPEKSYGVEIVSAEDGQWENTNVAGRKAIVRKENSSPASGYIYFQLSPEVRNKLTSDAYVVIDFCDERVIGKVSAEFNAKGNPYTGGPAYIQVGSDKWDRAVLHFSKPKFEGRQNGGADFRLCNSGPIARVEIYSSKPGVKVPSDRERVAAMVAKFKTDARPQNMFYTFGNGADELTAPMFRALGVTSIENYVTWETVEGNGEGQWDWSKWDKQVRILKENGLKWVPFLILGPAYSTPGWFRSSSEHVPCRCLEHGTDSKIESLWNPNLPKWIDRFIGEFAKRYKDSGVIESVLLGIQGDYGEAIYSVSGGGWTFNVPGEYHNHPGFWCGDPYAIASFRKFVAARYTDISAVNVAWKTNYASFDEVDFPSRGAQIDEFRSQLSSANGEARRRWLDFIDWYRQSMTEWSDWWLATTRKYFPSTPIYLCTGGYATPDHCSNFAEQCRVAAKYKGGVRITNEASNYAQNFVLTRWVASAGKHYGSYFGFEPAGPENERGIVARIYNATASGANQLHDYNPNVVNSRKATDIQQNHIKYLFHVSKPVVPVALWYPNVSLSLNWGGFLEKASVLRDYIDFDFVDETMLHTGALDEHKVLLIIAGSVMETADAKRISQWMEKGGRVIVIDVPRFQSVEATSEPETLLFDGSPNGRAFGKGDITRVASWDSLAIELRNAFLELNIPAYDLEKNGVYVTQISDNRFLMLNTNDTAFKISIWYSGKNTEVNAAAGTITDIKL